MTKFYDQASGVVRKVYERRIDAPPVLEVESDFPNARKFADQWEAIRDEAKAARLDAMPRFHDIMPEQADISANDGLDWRMLILKAYDVPVEDNLARMPLLTGLLDECPEVKSATVSFLAPRKHIPRHRGPFRGIMRFHLGLQIPQRADGTPATTMLIDDEDHSIGDGEMLLWDDTFPHEVINDADEPRIALLLDVWRPRMPVDMEVLSRIIVGAVKIGMRYRGVSYTG
ncbi:aspartyl/asparaginyl beta-hydroxylase domain-containing protein [Bauldia sp.]|uniref:aspartyl/asparaginyl beta-hydroxylase domain-containing protein n=1 Tax=Bauldia sp. TaxID=2575872 RepID=UPI003BAD1E45